METSAQRGGGACQGREEVWGGGGGVPNEAGEKLAEADVNGNRD